MGCQEAKVEWGGVFQGVEKGRGKENTAVSIFDQGEWEQRCSSDGDIRQASNGEKMGGRQGNWSLGIAVGWGGHWTTGLIFKKLKKEAQKITKN